MRSAGATGKSNGVGNVLDVYVLEEIIPDAGGDLSRNGGIEVDASFSLGKAVSRIVVAGKIEDFIVRCLGGGGAFEADGNAVVIGVVQFHRHIHETRVHGASGKVEGYCAILRVVI